MKMLRRAGVIAARAAVKRSGSNAAGAVLQTQLHVPVAVAASVTSQVRWSSSTKKPVVQVLHHNPPQTYAQVEQDIAAMQREIRDAYKYVICRSAMSYLSLCAHACIDRLLFTIDAAPATLTTRWKSAFRVETS